MLRYIELDGKVPIHGFDTFSTDHKNYKDAGVILNNTIVVVDFDERTEAAEKIFHLYPTLRVHTSRGFHLWYRKPNKETINTPIRNYTNKLTVAGLKVDYKTGNKAQAKIKENYKLRKMDNEHYLQNIETLPTLPELLYPSKLKHDILGMKEHEGRNSALYSHILSTCEQYNLNDEEMKSLSHFINKYIFDEPLDDNEINSILESVKNKKQTSPTKQKYLDPKDIIMTSEVLVEKLDIHYFRGKLFFKNNNHYISDDNLLLRAIDQLIPLKPSQHKQLIDLFKIKSHLQDDDDLPVQFNNGFCLYDNEVVEIDPGFTPFYLNVAYDEDAYDEHVDQFLDWFTCNRKDLRQFIEEIFGHIIMTKGFPHRAFFFWGESGGNGKSTFIKMIQSFADGLHTNVPLDKFDDDTTVYSLIGKLLNVADDINASYLEKSSNFKTIASGDPVMIRPIYSPAMTLNNKGTLVFTCNEIPVFKDKTGGIKRRIRVIPCDARVTKRDMDIDEKLSTDNAKSYILRLAIEGMQRILQQGDMSRCKAVDDITKEYFVQSDSVLGFLEHYSVDGKERKNAYMQYTLFCEESGLKPVGSTEFGRRLKKEGYEPKRISKGNKRPWIYKKKEEVS